jgi:hypothetical protein
MKAFFASQLDRRYTFTFFRKHKNSRTSTLARILIYPGGTIKTKRQWSKTVRSGYFVTH